MNGVMQPRHGRGIHIVKALIYYKGQELHKVSCKEGINLLQVTSNYINCYEKEVLIYCIGQTIR